MPRKLLDLHLKGKDWFRKLVWHILQHTSGAKQTYLSLKLSFKIKNIKITMKQKSYHYFYCYKFKINFFLARTTQNSQGLIVSRLFHTFMIANYCNFPPCILPLSRYTNKHPTPLIIGLVNFRQCHIEDKIGNN